MTGASAARYPGESAGGRGSSARAVESIRRLQAGDRVDASRHGGCPRLPLHGAPASTTSDSSFVPSSRGRGRLRAGRRYGPGDELPLGSAPPRGPSSGEQCTGIRRLARRTVGGRARRVHPLRQVRRSLSDGRARGTRRIEGARNSLRCAGPAGGRRGHGGRGHLGERLHRERLLHPRLQRRCQSPVHARPGPHRGAPPGGQRAGAARRIQGLLGNEPRRAGPVPPAASAGAAGEDQPSSAPGRSIRKNLPTSSSIPDATSFAPRTSPCCAWTSSTCWGFATR